MGEFSGVARCVFITIKTLAQGRCLPPKNPMSKGHVRLLFLDAVGANV